MLMSPADSCIRFFKMITDITAPLQWVLLPGSRDRIDWTETGAFYTLPLFMSSIVSSITGAAPRDVITCRTCSEGISCGVPCTNLMKFEWCIALQCPNCNFKWFICNLCSVQHSFMTNRSDVIRHNRYHKHDKMSNEGTDSKRQKSTGEVMDTSHRCQNNAFCDASNSSFIPPSPEEGGSEEHKLMKFLLPGPPHFSNANAISQNFFTSKYMGKGSR
jgi:hypothetical protein